MCSVDRIEHLEIRVFVIGYKKEGEAIVVLFRDKTKDKVLYSMAIDSYSFKGTMKSKRNLTDEILRRYHVDNLSVLCWTHPHMDHSKDLLKIFHKYCRVSTKVIKPQYFDNKNTDIIVINDYKTKRLVDALFRLNALNRDTVESANASPKGYMMTEEFDIESGNAGTKTVQVLLMSPINSIIGQYFKEGKKLEDLNGISVALLLDVDGYCMMFAGDTINEHIDLMNKKKLRECRFVKAPHHTSLTARSMVNYLEKEKLDSACTTIKGVKLPVDDVVNLYKNKTDYFFSTGYKETSKQQTYFGIVEYIYNFEQPDIHMSVNLYGNAHQI